MAEWSSLAITAIFVQNLLFAGGFCSRRFFTLPGDKRARARYGVAVMLACAVCAAVGYVLRQLILAPLGAQFLGPFLYLALVALFTSGAKGLLARLHAPKEWKATLPAATYNYAVPGLLFFLLEKTQFRFLGTVYYALCAGAGLLLAVFVMDCALDRMRHTDVPAPLRGLPIALVTAGLISLAFMGFSGIRIPY